MRVLLAVLTILGPILFLGWVRMRARDTRLRRDLKIADKHYERKGREEAASQEEPIESPKALAIAAERYANGEISKDEYEEIKASL